jgi:hypothetical protein
VPRNKQAGDGLYMKTNKKPSSEDAAVHQAAANIAERRMRGMETMQEELKKNANLATLADRKKRKRSEAKKTTKVSKIKVTDAEKGGKTKTDKNPTEETTAACDPKGEMLVPDETTEEGDEDFAGEDWEIVAHAVDERDRIPKFKVHNGRREDKRDKYLWGTVEELKKDGVVGMEVYIQTKCNHPVYTALLRPKRKKKASPTRQKRMAVVSKKTTCNHGDYSDRITYIEERNAAYCSETYYLHGLKCGDGCGSTFVSRASEQKEGMTGIVPTGSAPIYCCVNIRGKDASTSDEAMCSHAVCFGCWTKGVLNTSGDNAARRRRSSSRK